jgi:hypothetical protein
MAALTFSLVYSSPNRLLYLLTADGTGTAGTLPALGGATPDLLTDSKVGPIQRCAQAFTLGFGSLAAGAMTQTNARAIWLSQNASAISPVPATLATARARACTQTPAALTFAVDANVDGGGHPNIVVTPSSTTGTGLLEVEIPGVIGE